MEGSDDGSDDQDDVGDYSRKGVVGFERPSLLQDLKNILHEYPDDGQIFKEMVQNAEDAGARTVKIVSVSVARTSSPLSPREQEDTSRSAAKTWKPPFVDTFSVPGLCVYNDARFTDEDWSGIRKLHDSVKVKNPLKVGRFGLGFKSVFHLTDHPVIISGRTVLFMDPFRKEHKAIYMTSLCDLDTEEQQAIRHTLVPLLHVLPDNSLNDKRFKGTVFWFPLRQKPSALSETEYTQERVHQLKQTLRSEINTLLLFLKRLETIEVFSHEGDSSSPVLDFSVSLSAGCIKRVRLSREKFLSAITTQSKACPRQQAAEASFLVLETCDTHDGQTRKNEERWLVLNFHQGLDDMSQELRDLCQKKSLTHRPYVGVAAKLNSQLEAIHGQLFCFLPLPPEKPSPTGLPVHVHGFFELSQNRRHLKWPSSAEGDNSGPADDALVWNRLLVTEVLPRAYVRLLTELASNSAYSVEESLTEGIDAKLKPKLDMVAKLVYELCPNPDIVTSRWQQLLAPLYKKLSLCPMFFSHSKGGHWIHLQEAVVIASPASDLSKAAEAAVVHLYEVCQVNLVRLPQHVLEGLNRSGLSADEDIPHVKEQDRKSYLGLNSFNIVCPISLAELMKRDKRWSSSLSREEKCLILDYICRQGNQSLLADLELLPLADGTFCECSEHVVYVCRDQEDLRLLSGILHCLCFVSQPEGLHEQLMELARSGFGDLKLLTDEDTPSLLKRSLEALYSDLGSITITKEDPWIRQVWKYLQEKSLKDYDHLPLLPCLQDNSLQLRPLQGNYVCWKLEGFPPPFPALGTALGHLGVHVVPSLPDYVIHHCEVLHYRVQPASCLGVLTALARLAEDGPKTVDEAVNRSNAESSADEKIALVEILAVGLNRSEGEEEKEKWVTARTVLRRLKLFPMWPNCMETHGDGILRKMRTQEDTNRGSYNSAESLSIQENGHMTPDISSHAVLPPPVRFATKLLHCDSKSHRQLALNLGAKEVALEDLTEKMLVCLSNSDETAALDQDAYNKDVTDFMIYFLQSPVFENEKLKDMARRIRFVPTMTSGELSRADELYNPEIKLLQDLFLGENRFPAKFFYQGKNTCLKNLMQLGLRNDTAVAASDLICAATNVDEICRYNNVDRFSTAKIKSTALWHFLEEHSHRIPEEVIKQVANLQCLPCVNSRKHAPADYPEEVPVCPQDYEALGIARAVDMCHNSQLLTAGSIRPVSLPASSDCYMGSFFYQPTVDDVIQHLEMVTSRFNKQQSHCFASILYLIYNKLSEICDLEAEYVKKQMEDLKCILTEKDGCFRCPPEFWIQEEDNDDLDLSPYRFPLPVTLISEGFSEFFVNCGCRQQQDPGVLSDVLEEIQKKHTESHHNKERCKKDLNLVQQILKTLSEKGVYEKGEVLVPVHSEEKDCPQLLQSKDCTVAPDPSVIELISEEEEDMIFVHPAIDRNTALALGALDLRSRTLTGVDDLEMDDSAFGQYELLTTRLHNLLQDGYTDGFSVPKELMQNADDAGATVVKFLVDERDNQDWRSGLLTLALSDLQGPALWVFNDAEFSNKDFDNLCKLGGATKKEDCSKVGKFGLGFNAVYNITEVPSVYSGSTLAMLDPHESYLDKGRGKKMNFNNIMNKVLLKRMPNQFRPFQGVFSCDILNKDWKPFSGTLFRFPFRTESQAEISQICKEAFTEHKQQDFIRSLVCKAGNLMLFLQHVTQVELYHLSKDAKDPAEAKRLVTMVRTSASDMTFRTPDNCGILDHFSKLWQSTMRHGSPPEEHRVIETVTLSTECDGVDRQKCSFRVAWTTGKSSSCDIARETREEGFVPLAAVGIPVEDEGKIMSIESCPEGFYRSGHLFCFLPLAREVCESHLPVHINAPFALTSDRRGLLTQTEDDRKLVGGRWNTALFSDPIPRAYLAALESVAGTQETGEVYYSLWPQKLPQSARRTGSPQTALFPHFYQLLVQEHFSVFLHPDGCVPFSEAFFFDPDFKDTRTGKVAFKILKMFWDESAWRSKFLIDIPTYVAANIKASGQARELREKVITEEQFFKDFLFPKIAQGDITLESADRNQLVLHALLSDAKLLQELVRTHACIPCLPDGRLNSPARLVHPDGLAAPLFSEDDGRFPQKSEEADFRSYFALSQLLKVGMVKDKLSKEELLERALSVEKVPRDTAVQRAKHIIKYFPSLKEEMTFYAAVLTNVRFLPVLGKPTGWPLQWYGDEETFIEPSVAFSSNLKELVGCQAAVLNEVPLDLSATDWETLTKLGVTWYKSSSSTDIRLTEVTVAQLIGIAEDPDALNANNTKAISDICKEIYKHLNSFCLYGMSNHYQAHRQKLEILKKRAVVWTKHGFQVADQLAMGSHDKFEPYLIYVDGFSWQCHQFFTFLGVKSRFETSHVLDALRQFSRDERSSAPLNSCLINVIHKLAELLDDTLITEKRGRLEEGDVKDVCLPDKHGLLYPVEELCLDDCDWLEESDTMHFLHSKFSEHLARTFCVRTKRECDEDEFLESFGQHEHLTTRINRLLEGYTRDASIFKELLQNADDAGATEVRFLKDLRRHNTDKLLHEKWQHLCGPALCVFNDAPFTPRDMQGIQALGEGSKEEDVLKTGKYGVGFNAIYNLTDTPCFWTRVVPNEEDESEVNEKKLGEKLCVMDPNFFVASRRSRLPGQQVSVTDRFRAQYSNMLSPFLLESDNTQKQTGTVFRFPLRTEKNASVSKIKQDAATMEEVNNLLKDFETGMGECLLFLNNVKKVGVYTANEDGKIEMEYETHLSTDKENTEKRREFFWHLQNEAKKLKSEKSIHSLKDFASKETPVQCCLTTSDGGREDWLVVKRFGLSEKAALSGILQHQDTVQKYKLLPLGGVALSMHPEKLGQKHPPVANKSPESVKSISNQVEHFGKGGSLQRQYYDRDTDAKRHTTTFRGTGKDKAKACTDQEKESNYTDSADGIGQREFLVYCMLPLPVNTGLPVHVNGCFALDHETRHNIDTKPNSDLVTWNKLVADSVIVPAYIRALYEIKQICFSKETSSLCNSEDRDRNDNDCGESKSREDEKLVKVESNQKLQKSLQKADCLITSTDLGWKLKCYNNFFPDHRKETDDFWKLLMKSFYQELADTEADVFPAVRKDLGRLVWVPVVKSSGFPGYFWRQSSEALKSVLMKLNMNIIECCFRIYEAFHYSAVSSVKKICAETVIDFLRSCHRGESETDRCNLKYLPRTVFDTAFGDVKSVIMVFKFIHKNVENLEGLPLCLRMSETLHYFSSGERTLYSRFCDLLPASNELFLNCEMIRFLPNNHRRFLKALDIETLADLLPRTLNQWQSCRGPQPLLETLDQNSFPKKLWIQRFWHFLDEQLQSVDLHTVVAEVACLNQWSLIPAIKDTAVYLFPLSDKYHVVYIPDRYIGYGTFDDEPMNEILEKLPLITLEKCLSNSVARKLVASTKNPMGLLTALLYGNVGDHNLTSDEAENILDFFFRKLDCNNCSVVKDIRSLPFFERPDGTFMAVGNTRKLLCLLEGIPKDGLKEWSENGNISLLKNHNRLQKLFEQLGIAKPNELEFYTLHLFPSIADLSEEAIPMHMKYIRDHFIGTQDGQALVEILRQTRFIKGPDRTLSFASDFFSPDCKVFEVMMSQDRFPPPPYDTDEWKLLLQNVGLVCEVSEELFLKFARQVEKAGRNSVSERVEQQSQELARCLKCSTKLRSEEFLRQLQDVKFLMPLRQSHLENGDLLQTIHSLFVPSTQLVSFSEGFSPDMQFLLWTSSCLLFCDADPTRFDAWTVEMNDWIEFKPDPPKHHVVKHLQNICQSLSTKGKGDTSLLEGFDDKELAVVENIMEITYAYLSSFPEVTVKCLQDLAIIFDKKRKKMFSPYQVVIKILEKPPPGQIVEGHVVDAPEKLGKFFDLFRKLGVSQEVSVDHYARALERIHAASCGDVLNPNDLKLVSVAVHNLFNLLKLSPDENNLIQPVLYLPAEDISMLTRIHDQVAQVKLMDSRKLILEVNYFQQKRVKIPVKNLAVFVDFGRLGLEGHDLHREACLLHESQRMKNWNDVLTETLVESCKTLAREDEDTRFISDLLQSEEFTVVVKRLVNYKQLKKGRKFTDDDAREIEERLNELTLLKVSNLQTVLNMNGCELSDTKENQDFFIVQGNNDGKSSSLDVTKVFLYVDSAQVIGYDFSKNRDLMSHIRKAVSLAVGFKLNVLLDCGLEDLPSAQRKLDKEGITPYQIRSTRTVFPPPGSFIPEDMYFLLDNDVYEFKPGEYVAFELFDPNIDSDDTNSGGFDEGSGGATEQTEESEGGQGNVKKPRYIFARVTRIIAPPDDTETDVRTRLLLLHYMIDVGDEEPKEVEACELYKFVRPTPNVIVPFTGDTTPPHSAFSSHEADDDLKKVLKDIRHQLRKIWSKLPDNKSRKRAVKRLLLKWHPDKNPGRDDLCTRVCQEIQFYVLLLESGKELLSDDEDNVDSCPPAPASYHHRASSYRSGTRGFCGTFFSNIFSRGRTYAESSRTFYSNTGSRSWSYDFFRSSCRSNPQPEEGRRWMRQAMKDLEAARVTLIHGGLGTYNWACYQAHQTAEKALKAVLYRRDAGHGMRTSHDICSLALRVLDDQIVVLTSKLHNVSKYHTRMRYPDFSEFPKIPSDMYSNSEAAEACELADQIIQRAQYLFDTYRTPPPSPPRQWPRSPPSPPRYATSYHAISSSSSRGYASVTSSSAAARPAITSRPADPPRLALPPP